MKNDLNGSRDVWGPLFAAQIRGPGEILLELAQNMANLTPGLLKRNGDFPVQIKAHGGGASLSNDNPGLHFADETLELSEVRSYFNRIAEDYDSAVGPFSTKIFNAVLKIICPYIAPDFRILDPSCGTGREAVRLTQYVPAGEVIASDISEGMIHQAFYRYRQSDMSNMAFFQGDITGMPEYFIEYFDMIFCMVSFRYFSDGYAAARAMLSALAPGALVFAVEPVYNELTFQWLSQWERLMGFHSEKNCTPEDIKSFFINAGFGSVVWQEVLPGINMFCACID